MPVAPRSQGVGHQGGAIVPCRPPGGGSPPKLPQPGGGSPSGMAPHTIQPGGALAAGGLGGVALGAGDDVASALVKKPSLLQQLMPAKGGAAIGVGAGALGAAMAGGDAGACRPKTCHQQCQAMDVQKCKQCQALNEEHEAKMKQLDCKSTECTTASFKKLCGERKATERKVRSECKKWSLVSSFFVSHDLHLNNGKVH